MVQGTQPGPQRLEGRQWSSHRGRTAALQHPEPRKQDLPPHRGHSMSSQSLPTLSNDASTPGTIARLRTRPAPPQDTEADEVELVMGTEVIQDLDEGFPGLGQGKGDTRWVSQWGLPGGSCALRLHLKAPSWNEDVGNVLAARPTSIHGSPLPRMRREGTSGWPAGPELMVLDVCEFSELLPGPRDLPALFSCPSWSRSCR